MRVDIDHPIFLANPDSESAPRKVVRLSRQEYLFIREYITCGEITESCRVSGLAPKAAVELMARPEIKSYVDERVEEMAESVGLTKEKVLRAVNQLVDNPSYEPSKGHLRALDIAARILKMIQPTQNIQATIFQNPFADKSDAELDAEIKNRLGYTEEHGIQPQ